MKLESRSIARNHRVEDSCLHREAGVEVLSSDFRLIVLVAKRKPVTHNTVSLL